MLTSPLLGLVLDGVIGGLALEELLAAAAGRHVLDAHVDALADDTVADLRAQQRGGSQSIAWSPAELLPLHQQAAMQADCICPPAMPIQLLPGSHTVLLLQIGCSIRLLCSRWSCAQTRPIEPCCVK